MPSRARRLRPGVIWSRRKNDRERMAGQVDAVGVAGKRHVDPIVDQQRRPRSARRLAQCDSQFEQRTRLEIGYAVRSQLAEQVMRNP